MLVSDGRTGNVEVFDAAEKHVRTVKPLDVGSGTRDADTDAQGNVYVADYRNHRINKSTPTGAFVTSWDGGTNCRIPKPYGVEVDDNGRVFIASSNSNLIRVFTRDGACLRTYGRNGTGPDRVKACLHHHRKHDRQRHQHDRDRLDEAPERDEEDDEAQEVSVVGSAERDQCRRDHRDQAGIGQKAREQDATHHDDEDH